MWVQGDVAISKDATLHAPVLLGPDVQISSGATVGSSVIGAGAEISSGANLVRSVLHRAATVATGAEVIDSVLGAASHVGAGAGLADLTLVGAGASVGVGHAHSGGRVKRVVALAAPVEVHLDRRYYEARPAGTVASFPLVPQH